MDNSRHACVLMKQETAPEQSRLKVLTAATEQHFIARACVVAGSILEPRSQKGDLETKSCRLKHC